MTYNELKRLCEEKRAAQQRWLNAPTGTVEEEIERDMLMKELEKRILAYQKALDEYNRTTEV